MIDVPALATLRAVQAHGSVVAAAAALGYTPSAVSQQVKRLERQTGSQLVERFGRGLMLTDQGRRLVGEGSGILDAIELLESRLAAASTTPAHGELRLAAFSTAVRGLVAPAVAALGLRHPDLRVTVLEQDPLAAIDLVATGQADVALVHHWADLPLPVPGHVESVSLGIDVADVLVPEDHRLADRASVTPHDLVDEAWACPPVGSVCHTWLMHLYDGLGRTPAIQFWAGEFSSHVALVEHGVAVTLVPRLGREILPPTVRAVPVTDPVPTRRVELLWRRTMAPSPTVQAVRAAVGAVSDRRLAQRVRD